MTTVAINSVAFLVVIYLTVLVIAVFWRVAASGPGAIRKVRKMDYGWSAYWNASLRRQDPGSTIDVIEGLEIVADQDRIDRVRSTRTISRELA